MKKLPLLSVLVFILLLIIFGSFALFFDSEIKTSNREALQSRISGEIQSVSNSSQRLLADYEILARSAKALFDASDNVTREEWDNFFESVDIDSNFRSLSAVGVLTRVGADQKQEFEALVNSDPYIIENGFPEFKIYPETNQEAYPVNYIWPINGNEAAFGFDIISESSRREALEIARDTNSITITRPITLVQEKKQIKSFLMFVPIYTKDVQVDTLDQRREHIVGFISLVIRAEDLFDEVINANILPNINSFNVYDTTNGERVLFTSVDLDNKNLGNNPIIRTSTISIGGRSWLYEYLSDSQVRVVKSINQFIPAIILVLGFLISALVSIVTYNTLRLRYQAEKIAGELTQDLEKFKLAIDNASDQIVITDAEGVSLYANPVTEKITGYKMNDIIGSKAGSLWGGLMSQEYYQKMWKIIKTDKKIFSGEIKNRRKNGEEYLAEIKISPITNKTGEVEFFVAIERDITKEKRIDEMKTQFISLASHQLRTPLSAIRWYLEMLLAGESGSFSSDQRDIIKGVYDSTLRMISLVNGLLNISRMESGRIMISPEPTNFSLLVNNLLKELYNEILQHKIRIDLNIDVSVGIVDLDQDLIREVYRNIIINAIKYTPENGSVLINIKRDGDRILSEIKDTGIGIPDKDKYSIFNKFHRGSNVVSTDTEGTGLGMYLTKAIVESSGGKIWFESKEGQGTTFWFTLPAKGMIVKDGDVQIEKSEIGVELNQKNQSS